MAIARGTQQDLPEVVALLKQSALPTAGIARHITSTVVARDQSTIIGCAAVEIYGSAGLLRSVAVAEQRRGEGLGMRAQLSTSNPLSPRSSSPPPAPRG